MACDPQTLVDAAKCFNCLSPGQQWAVLVYLMCQIQQNGTGGGSEKNFTSQQFTLNQQTWNANHGLGGTPTFVRAVLVCVVNDVGSGYNAGDEVDVTSFFSGGNVEPVFGFGANATKVFVNAVLTPVGNEGGISLPMQNSGSSTSVTSFGNFRLKIYAEL